MKINHITPSFKTCFIACFAVFSTFLSFGQVKTPFYEEGVRPARFKETLNGDFTTIANNTVSYLGVEYNGPHNNNTYSKNIGDNLPNIYRSMRYIDVDGNTDLSTFNSSNATLNKPVGITNSCFKIKKAYLYWSAADKERSLSFPENRSDWNFNDVKLMLPGETSYTTYTADEVIYRGRDEHFSNDPYTCFKDITAQVTRLSDPFGKYQVANVESKEGALESHSNVVDGKVLPKAELGSSGGWQIVFVYENPNLPKRNITIYDGYAQVYGSELSSIFYNVEFNISGFKTIPNKAVNANILFGSLEGDRSLTGDNLQIRRADNGLYQSLSVGSIRNSGNFFKSKITIDNNEFIDREPASRNTLGFDAGVFKLNNPGNSIIRNNQTSVDIKLATSTDSYGLYLFGFSVEVYEPELGPVILDANISDGDTVTPNEIITNNITFKNRGNDDATSVILTATIDTEVDLKQPINGLPSGVTYDYTAGTGGSEGILTFTVPDNLVKVNSPDVIISYQTEVKDQCYFLAESCSLEISPKVTAKYKGVTNGNGHENNSSGSKDECGNASGTTAKYNINVPPGNWATPAGNLDRKISCDDTAALAAAQALTPAPNCLGIPNSNIIKTSGEFVPSTVSCAQNGTYTNTWTYTDKCGNSIADFIQVITIVDETKPDLSVCSDKVDLEITLECNDPNNQAKADKWNADNLAAIKGCVTDNCDVNIANNVVSDYKFKNSDTPICGSSGEKITVIYTIADECGNKETIEAKIIYQDTTGPSTSLCTIATSKTEECTGEAIATVFEKWHNENMAELKSCIEDECNPLASAKIVTNYNPANIVKSCGNGGSLKVEYYAEDECGNKSDTIEVTFTIEDTKAPDITVCTSLDKNTECNADAEKAEADKWNSDNIATLKSCANDVCDTTFELVVTSDYDFGNMVPSPCGNGGSITVTYTVQDACGRTAEVKGKFSSGDGIPPTIDTCTLEDITLECGKYTKATVDAWYNATIATIKSCAKDECEKDFIPNITDNYKFEDIKPAECGADGSITPVEFKISDKCGNTTTKVLNIIVKDTTGPDLSLCNDKLTDLVLECGDDNKTIADKWNADNLSTISTCATDGCLSVSTTIDSDYKYADILPAACGSEGNKTEVTYTVKDTCGNEETITVNIILRDTEGPDLSLCSTEVNDLVLECGEDNKAIADAWNTKNLSTISTCATDACVAVDTSINSNYKFEDILSGACGDEGSKTPVTYTVKDTCGNEETITVNIIVKDTKGPDLSLCADKVDDLILECGEDNQTIANAWNTKNLSAIAACATDGCVTVNTTIDSNYKFEDILPATCGDEGSKTPVTYTVQDACGNKETITVNIILKDTKGPDLSLCSDKIDDLILECGEDNKTIADTWNSQNLNAIAACATDACVTVNTTIGTNYSFKDILPVACGSEGSKTPVTYTVQDACGNEETITVNIILKDTKGPDLSICSDELENLVLECGNDNKTIADEWNKANLFTIENCAYDACLSINTTIESNYNFDDIKPAECGEGSTTTVTYTVKDICGNQETISVNIIVKDTSAPDITICGSLDKNTECNVIATKTEADKWNNENLSKLKSCATDACDPSFNLIVTSDYNFDNMEPSSCGKGGSLVVTYTIEDACGRKAEVKGKFSTGDSIPPVLDGCSFEDITLECGKYTQADVDAWHKNIVEGIKSCAKDDCEVDFTPMVTDDYDFTAIQPAECGSEGSITPVVFTISDTCGNETTKTVNIIVKDTTGPDLSLCNDKIRDLVLECGSDNETIANQWNASNLNTIATCATDTCLKIDNNIESNYSFQDILPAECGSEGSKTPVTYIVRDECGNEQKITVNIIVKDTTGPDLSLCSDKVEDLVLECGNDNKTIADAWNNKNLEAIAACATDACVSVNTGISSNYKFEDILPAACGNEGSKTPVTYTVSDRCGNTETITINIIVKDTTGPDLSLCKEQLKNLELECNPNNKDLADKWNANNLDKITACATDACVAVNTTITSNYKFEDILPAACGDKGSETPVTYTVKDACGNEEKITLSIFLKDTKGPDMTLCNDKIKDLVLECNANSEATADNWNKTNLESIKNCVTDDCLLIDSNIASNYNFNDIEPLNCGEQGSITPITYTVKDECGNKEKITVNIIYKDTKAPIVLNDSDSQVTVLCSKVPDVPKLEFSDACNNTVTIVDFKEESTYSDKVEDYIITRTWIVKDNCDNQATYTQTINVESQNFMFDEKGEHCTDDGIINLNDYATGHDNLEKEWVFVSGPDGQEVTIINNTFDPDGFEIGDYEFKYISPDGTCFKTTNLVLNLNDECIPLPCGLEDFTISKAITPNGDLYNEYFEVKGTRECGFKLRIKIFNRWGSIIYESNDYQNDWNGTTNQASIGNNGKVPNGTYYYLIEIINSGLKPVSGPIYIGTK